MDSFLAKKHYKTKLITLTLWNHAWHHPLSLSSSWQTPKSSSLGRCHDQKKPRGHLYQRQYRCNPCVPTSTSNDRQWRQPMFPSGSVSALSKYLSAMY
jgi:hypothetical protein